MFIFFGTRSSKLKDRFKLDHCTCPNCRVTGTHTVTTLGRYVHLFFIPVFPLTKTRSIECDHCKKTFAQEDLTDEMQEKLQRGLQVYPGKRPIWHGCGCLLIIGFILTSAFASFFISDIDTEEDEQDDIYKTMLADDIEKTRSHPSIESDSLGFYLSTCFDFNLVDDLSREEMAFFTKQNGSKLLVLVKMKEIKKIKRDQRKELLDLVKDCLYEIIDIEEYELFIGVHGRFSMMVVSTPSETDDIGYVASESILLPFYHDEPTIESILDTATLNLKKR